MGLATMQYSRILIACLTAACVSALAIAILYRFAEAWGLVDRPDERKHHVGHIPLIGGLAAFVGVLAGAVVDGQAPLFTNVLLATAAVLAVVGALDDRFDLSVRTRLLVQTAAVLTMVAVTGVHIHTLGHLFGQEFELGVFGIPLTVVAVIGLLNAFNMMDGIDGLAGMLALVSIAAIILYQGQPQWPGVIVLVLLAGALVPYLAANLGLAGKKIFLGDAGSMVVGYILAWTLIHLSQSVPDTELSTIDVLWCVALPVLDTLQVVVRRIREGKSPFKPDRGHIHHMMLRAGLGPRTTLVALVMLAIGLALTGMLTHSLAPGSNLLAFGALTVIYVTAMGRIWQKQQAAPARPQPRPTLEPERLPSNVVRLQSSVTFLSSYGKNSHGPKRGSAAK
ncbi:MAG TPA: MraY family glycosyltransferase [Frateuria sp.]|uniref:MraY family glycosyltransferase n=1 Tax=Frateuria sp. TaxID=2211372 RepID=UPI002D7E51A9|nr:MraY family glycosyltransferase [Frateuria sp.]HET6805221.1 MraY family glycosyltransferase [Frateuria sp.]